MNTGLYLSNEVQTYINKNRYVASVYNIVLKSHSMLTANSNDLVLYLHWTF